MANGERTEHDRDPSPGRSSSPDQERSDACALIQSEGGYWNEPLETIESGRPPGARDASTPTPARLYRPDQRVLPRPVALGRRRSSARSGAGTTCSSLPFTEKADLQAAQDADPPFGTNQAAPLDRLVRMQATGGHDLTADAHGPHPARRRGLQRDRGSRGVGGRTASRRRAVRVHELQPVRRRRERPHDLRNPRGMRGAGRRSGSPSVSCRSPRTWRPMRRCTRRRRTPSTWRRPRARKASIPPGSGSGKGLFSGDAGLEDPAVRASIEDAFGMVARNIFGTSETAPDRRRMRRDRRPALRRPGRLPRRVDRRGLGADHRVRRRRRR